MSAVPARTARAEEVVADLATIVPRLDWECVTADTRYLTHEIHRYSSKFIPQMARQAIELLTSPGELVLDPMVGSGTTLVEAWLLRRKAIGIDLNPLAILIARVKTRRVNRGRLDRAVSELGAVVEAVRATEIGQQRMAETELAKAAISAASKDARLLDPWFAKWFQPHVLRDLLIVDHAIRRIDDDRVRDVARVAFSEILRRSSNAHGGYPNVMFNRRSPRKPSPGPIFARTLRTYAERVKELEELPNSEPNVEERDARQTALADDSIDAIVSHPPYIGSVPYAEYGLLSLRWLQVDDRELDSRLLGGKRRSPDVTERFRTMYSDVLSEANRVLRRGRVMCLVVGDPVVRGKVVDLARMTRELAAASGFVEIAFALRSGVNRRANKMSHETILFFEKTI
jgi:SAM-dependent methyltransferase